MAVLLMAAVECVMMCCMIVCRCCCCCCECGCCGRLGTQLAEEGSEIGGDVVTLDLGNGDAAPPFPHSSSVSLLLLAVLDWCPL
eukprot:gnl/Chilomastix_caulleri/5951.p3 GENE.gnl/Chilomastix_caulleri/5951~~gnl/Chilomastix_caulleri/5951.p3  ORF type:complete len:84 (+),score=26.58 gnl/Chilomastix_caulleri/5951:68-319(+)